MQYLKPYNIYQAHPLPPVERFPRNLHSTTRYATLNHLLQVHPLLSENQHQLPLMVGSHTAASAAVWNLLYKNRTEGGGHKYTYGKVRSRKPDTASNRNN